jgi:hypothetical protein
MSQLSNWLYSVTVNDPTKYNSGGTISVNGRTITVPDNLIVQFPATWANFRDFAASDILGKEVSIAGNIVSMTREYDQSEV